MSACVSYITCIAQVIIGIYKQHTVHLRSMALLLSHSVLDQFSADKYGRIPQDLLKCFEVFKKCRNKFDCLLYEMLYIRTLKPNLNVQSDSIRGKVFV